MAAEHPVDIEKVLSFFKGEPEPLEFGQYYPCRLRQEIYESIKYAPLSKEKNTKPATDRLDSIDLTRFSGGRQGIKSHTRGRPNNYICPYEFLPAIEVSPQWFEVAHLDTPHVSSMTTKDVPTYQDIKICGSTGVVSGRIRGFHPNNLIPLVSTTDGPVLSIEDDPIIQEIASQPLAAGCTLRIFGTADMLGSIGACTRSVFPYYVVFSKKNNHDLYISARDPKCSAAADTYLETLSTPNGSIAKDRVTAEFFTSIEETTQVSYEFRKTCVDQTNPISFGASPASSASEGDNSNASNDGVLIYRRMILGNLEFIIRGTADAIDKTAPKAGERADFVLCRAFNDIPTIMRQVDWVTQVQKSPASVFTQEAGYNSAKVARWAATALFLGIEKIYVGYVFRKTPNNKKAHTTIGTEKYLLKNFSRLISMTPASVYGSLKDIFERFVELKDADYTFVRDNKKKEFSIYRCDGGLETSPAPEKKKPTAK